MNGGAVAYLTHSPYGRNGKEVTINNSSTYITGSAGGSVSASYSSGTYVYNTPAGMLASTTGNITGIYDMSGGVYEYVAAYNKNGGYYLSNGNSFVDSGKSTKYATAYDEDDNAEPSSSRCIVGDATYEVYEKDCRAWFNDLSYSLTSPRPFYQRGGEFGEGTNAGIFSACYISGPSQNNCSFRICLPGV